MGGIMLEVSVLLRVKFIHDSLLPSAEAHPRAKARTQSSPSALAKTWFLVFPKVSLGTT